MSRSSKELDRLTNGLFVHEKVKGSRIRTGKRYQPEDQMDEEEDGRGFEEVNRQNGTEEKEEDERRQQQR